MMTELACVARRTGWLVLSCLALQAAPLRLSCDGLRIVNSTGGVVALRGVNLGGWLLNEIWMTHTYGVNDDAGIRATLATRFGASGRDALMNVFQQNFMTGADFDTIAGLGFNCVRLPFFYRVLEDDAAPGVYLSNGWALLDWAVSNCAARGLYCVLDLHGAPGAQSVDQTTGQENINLLYSGTNYQARTVALWQAIAARYATEPCIAAYDLLNEPWGDFKAAPPVPPNLTVWTGLYARLVAAIRAVDPQRIIMLQDRGPSCPIGDLPTPATLGVSNLVYQFHLYDFIHSDFAAQNAFLDECIRQLTSFQRARGVPFCIGEFHPQGGQQAWAYFLRQLSAEGWSWMPWSYKCHGANGDWGVRRTSTECNVQTDSVATLSNAFVAMRTTWSDPLLDYTLTTHTPGLFDPGSPRSTCYRNTFNGPDGTRLDAYGQMLLTLNGGSAVFAGRRARVTPPNSDWGLVFCKALTRATDDLRCGVQDATGSVVSLALEDARVARTNAADYEAEFKLGLFREPIVNNPYDADVQGVMVIADYNVDNQKLRLHVHAKTGGSGNNGASLSGDHLRTFVPGAALQIQLAAATVAVSYNGYPVWSGAHGLDLHTWLSGGVAIATISHYGAQRLAWADLDDFMVTRADATAATNFSDEFNYPEGMPLDALAEAWSCMPDGGATTLVTNGSAWLQPPDDDWAQVWLTAQTDAQNPARLPLAEHELTVALDLTGFTVTRTAAGDDAQLLATLMPEYFGGPVWDYNGTALVVEVCYDADAAKKLAFNLYRHEQAYANGTPLFSTNNLTFIPGAVCTITYTPSTLRLAYHTTALYEGLHGVDTAAVYPAGAPLHLAAQNLGTARGAVRLDRVQASIAAIPEPVGVGILFFGLFLRCVAHRRRRRLSQGVKE
jgi:hypothetical protein